MQAKNSKKRKQYVAAERRPEKYKRKREEFSKVSNRKKTSKLPTSNSSKIAREKAYKKRRKQLFDFFFYLLTISLLLFALFFAANRDKTDGSLLGYSWYNVQTNSMVPSASSPKGGFYAGDLILVRKTDFADLQVGDVVTFRLTGAAHAQLTHRIVEKRSEYNGVSGNYIVTKGDANAGRDSPVEESRIIGKVIFVVPKVGGIFTSLKKHWVIVVILFVLVYGGFSGYHAYQRRKKEKERRKRGHAGKKRRRRTTAKKKTAH